MLCAGDFSVQESCPHSTCGEAKASWVKGIFSGVAPEKEGPWGEDTLKGSEDQEGETGSLLGAAKAIACM